MGVVNFTQWNVKELLEDKVDTVLDEMGVTYSQVADDNIASQIWQWKYDTLRFKSLLMGGEPQEGGGVLVKGGMPRDIVDTGDLRNSRQLPRLSAQDGKRSMSILWDADYAQLIRTGGHFPRYTLPNGKRFSPGIRPGRDWIAKSLEDAPALPMFTAIWNSFNITRS